MKKEIPIDVKTLLKILDDWQSGVIDERTVHREVEYIVDNLGQLPEYSKNSFESIVTEVLFLLDAINQHLFTKEDISAIQEFLLTPKGKEIIGWEQWKNYWENIDINLRKTELKNNPFYCV